MKDSNEIIAAEIMRSIEPELNILYVAGRFEDTPLSPLPTKSELYSKIKEVLDNRQETKK